MKKILSLVLFLGAIIILTGCVKKPSTLVCTQTVSGVTATLTSNFMGKELKTMGLTYTMDLSKYSDSSISAIEKKDFCSSVQNAMPQFTLVDCVQVIEDKQLLLTAGIDLSKMSKKDLKGSPAATKTELEKQGYKCEIK